MEAGLKKIEDLNGKSFHVPNYQRGYKWKEKDVEHLIEDICEIEDNDTNDYCLQPIVVAHQNDNEYILVDGQQRLTTIWLIINWCKNNKNNICIEYNYKIEYETRGESNRFLGKFKNGEEKEEGSTCDTHYFNNAIKVIESKSSKLDKFISNLNKNVKIIWYEIDAQKGPEHFERLNNAKISLTNSELVKAYILTNDQESRSRTSCEWDEMEYRLQDDSFFKFITKKGYYQNEYNRIELLLDLYAETQFISKEQDEFHTFNTIIGKEGSPLDKWKEIQKIFNKLMCWYNDKFIYNILGFMVETGEPETLLEIWRKCNNLSNKDCSKHIRGELIKQIPNDDKIRSLKYTTHKTVKEVLLLFNILSMMQKKTDGEKTEYVFNDKFHFELYKKEDWDIEHVHATNSKALQKKTEWVLFLKNIDIKLIEKNMPDNEEKKKEIIEWINKAKEVNSEKLKAIKEDKDEVFKELKKENFESIYNLIIKTLEGEEDDDQDSIGNLVLLNLDINRAGEYKNAPFSSKRSKIMEYVKTGKFVPIATQNVFMKVFTPNPGNFYRWEKSARYNDNEKSDKEYYIDEIINTINRIK